MKKFITLLIAFSTLATTFAQDSRSEEAKRVILGKKRDSRTNSPSQDPRDVVLDRDERRNGGSYPETYPYPNGGSREAQIDQINRDYDLKVQSIRNNPYLSADEKSRIIRRLNEERAERIRQVNYDYRYGNSRDKRYDDDDDDYGKNKKYKKDNGKHLGWEKGRGNPHRSRY